MNNANLLCFDFGEKRIGVAVGQALTATATPLETVNVKSGRPDWDHISRLIEQWRPRAFVVGQPFGMDGSRQRLTALAEKFARQLQGRFHLPVHCAEERLTSYEARQRLKGVRDVDAVAAQIILESWLAEHTQNTGPDVTIIKTTENSGRE